MRHETEGVTESLLREAKKEFLTYGFYHASMRRISAACKVSTNSIYSRFRDKAGLFQAVVGNAADGLMQIYLASMQRAEECTEASGAVREGNEGTEQVLAYIYEHKEEMQLIFCHSAGTAYENYFDRLAEIEESYYQKFAELYAAGKKIDRFFIHVYCRMGWQYVYELLMHDKSYEEAEAFMKNVREFNFAGWQAFLDDAAEPVYSCFRI